MFNSGAHHSRRSIFCLTAALAALIASDLKAGDFTLDWGVIDWPAGSTAPLTATLKDQYGFEVDTRIEVSGTFTSGGGIVSPDDTSLIGGNVESLGLIVDALPNLGRIGDSTATTRLSFSYGGIPLAVDGLQLDIVDIDPADLNAASDRCDFVTITGDNGNPALAAVSSTPTFLIGPGPGSGTTGLLNANQVQCIYLDGPAISPTSNNTDTGTVRATFPDGTSSVTVLFDESIGNVRTLISYDPAARGIGVLAASDFSLDQSISLVKTSNPDELPEPGTTITYTYYVTNEGTLPFNVGQEIVIQDDTLGTVTCPAITSEVPTGGTVECTADYTVTAADILAGGLTGAAVAGVGELGQTFDTRLQSNTVSLNLIYSLGYDFGDAPLTYLSPSHAIVSSPTVYLGTAAPDAEPSTQSDLTATGDDLAGADDEDGVVLPVLTQGTIVTINVEVAGDAYLQAWLDFNGNGLFENTAVERVAVDLRDDGTGSDIAAGDGEVQVSVTIPDDATTSTTYARFRWASQAGLGSSAPTLDGEVEDHSFVIVAAVLIDRGDAPASYGDPRHVVVPEIYLGNGLPDTETTTKFSVDAQGDDIDGIDDEDAVTAFPELVAGTIVPITVRTHETLSVQYDLGLPVLVPGVTNLQVWIDFNQNGNFGSNEQVALDYRDGGTGDTDGAFNNQITLNIAVPANIGNGDTYARIRWSTTSALTSDPFDGLNLDGEVEDYLVTLFNPGVPLADLSLAKTVLSAASGQPTSEAIAGEELDFVLTVTNDGSGVASGVAVRDLIPHGFAYVSDNAAAQTDSYDSGTGLWTLGDVVGGSSHSLTIRVTMRDTGEHTNTAEITASDLPDPDSDPQTGVLIDDLGDGIADDDEASATVALVGSGATLSGTVFFDNGANATAYDGLQGGSEAGTDRATVQAFDAVGVLIDTPPLTADGHWRLTLPGGYADAVTITVQPMEGIYLVSEAQPALPGLSNPDPRDGSVTFTPEAGQSYAGLDMGLIAGARLNEDQQSVIRAGQVVGLRHEYIANAPGSVAFAVDAQDSNVSGGFSAAIYLDPSCDGTADQPVTDALAVDADTMICLVARVSASSALPQGSYYAFDLLAVTTYDGPGITEEDRNLDRVTVEASQGTLSLSKTVRNVTRGTPEGISNGAGAGDVLEYRIYIENTGTLPAADIQIFDKTPPYTVLAGPVPSPVTVSSGVACSIVSPTANSPGYSGGLRWECYGLYPAGALGAVSFQVRVAP